MLRPITILFLALSSNLLFSNNGVLNPILFSKGENINQYTTRIPFKLVDHLIVVEAELLKKKGNFIIDTGAENMILNKNHFSNLYAHQRKTQNTTGVLHAVEDLYEK